MADVWNWQIGRTMTYPYEESRPRRQAGAVFDTNKCIGCQTCTMACKTCWTSGVGQEYVFWNNVETKPWGSYPMAWDVRVLEQLGPQHWADGVYRGKTIFEAAPPSKTQVGWAPDPIDYAYPNRGEDEANRTITKADFHLTLPYDIWFFYLPRVCNHCTYPACLQSCPRTSIYKRPEDGIVLIDQQRCRGYQVCVEACPYKKTFFNQATGISEKCVFCFPAVEQGILPRCMRTCIGKIRTFGYVSTPEQARENNPVDFLVHVRKVGLPLYPQLGLEPNVYYIPPVHVADEAFLTMLFGPGASAAQQTYRAAMEGGDDELLAVLLLNVSTDRIVTRFALQGGVAIGWDDGGEEVARVPLREPVIVRPAYDGALSAYRYNVP